MKDFLLLLLCMKSMASSKVFISVSRLYRKFVPAVKTIPSAARNQLAWDALLLTWRPGRTDTGLSRWRSYLQMKSRKHRGAAYFSGRPGADKANNTRRRTNHSRPRLACRRGNVMECVLFNAPGVIPSKPKQLPVSEPPRSVFTVCWFISMRIKFGAER